MLTLFVGRGKINIKATTSKISDQIINYELISQYPSIVSIYIYIYRFKQCYFPKTIVLMIWFDGMRIR